MAAASAAALPDGRLLTDRLPADEPAADNSRLAVIVVAAGRSSRMEGVDKTFAEIDGAPLVIHTLRRLAASDAVCRITLVVAKDAVARAGELTHRHAVPRLAAICAGCRLHRAGLCRPPRQHQGNHAGGFGHRGAPAGGGPLTGGRQTVTAGKCVAPAKAPRPRAGKTGRITAAQSPSGHRRAATTSHRA